MGWENFRRFQDDETDQDNKVIDNDQAPTDNQVG